MADFKLNSRAPMALAEISKIAHGRLQDFGENMVELAKRPPPQGSPVAKKHGGNNRDSIDCEPAGWLRFRVATQSGYGAYLELGTSKMAARPYFAPAYEETRQQFAAQKWE